jgi:hypothetical protein
MNSCIVLIICHKPVGLEKEIKLLTIDAAAPAVATAKVEAASLVISIFRVSLFHMLISCDKLVHDQPSSTWQVLLHPSALIVFPSSHSSVPTLMASPQTLCHTLPTDAPE